jgi:Fe-S-cluster containining protein
MTLEKYSEKTMSGWVKLKNQVSDDPKVNDRCIFLGADGKQCSIYEARPIQCRTYPFWPRLLSDPKEWSKEAVQPDTVAIEEGGIERHWTPEGGGCEGFTNPEASIINTRTIHRNHELYKMYTDMFPFLSSGDDENRLLAKTSVIQGVTKATTAWVEDFVLKYTLCPFAEHVFVTGGIRYRVFLGTDKKKIMEKVKYEMLALLTSKEEDVATTLLMLPFAFQDFQDFYDFSLDLEDIYLPALEKDTQGPGQVIVPKRKSLLQKKLAAKNSKMIDDIMDGGVDDKYRASGDSGDMGSVSFGGSGTLAGGKGMGGNVRTTGCPVVHTSNSESSSDDSINYSSNSISNNSDNDSENSNGADINTISSSQPFREEDQDSLPEIQVRMPPLQHLILELLTY